MDTLSVEHSSTDLNFGGGFHRGNILPCTLTGSFTSRGTRFTDPLPVSSANTTDHASVCGISSKEVCQIPMMPLMSLLPYTHIEEEEEPPPTYEEALSHSKLMQKLQASSSIEETSVRVQCESDNEDDSCASSILSKNDSERNGERNSMSSVNRLGSNTHREDNNASPRRTTTTAIFFSDEDTDEDEQDCCSNESETFINSKDRDSKIDIDTNNNSDKMKALCLAGDVPEEISHEKTNVANNLVENITDLEPNERHTSTKHMPRSTVKNSECNVSNKKLSK